MKGNEKIQLRRKNVRTIERRRRKKIRRICIIVSVRIFRVLLLHPIGFPLKIREKRMDNKPNISYR